MGKENITQKFMDYLLNEKEPITERLKEYDKKDPLVFISSPGFLYPQFSDLVCSNPMYRDAFIVAKKRSIEAIREKQRTISYEDFLRHLFFDLGYLWNSHHKPDGELIFDITPTTEQEVNVMEEVVSEYLKTSSKKINRFRNGYNSLEVLKGEYIKRMEREGSDKEMVKDGLINQYVKPIIESEQLSKTYRNRNEGKEIKPDFGKEYSFSFFRDKHTVLEIIKFQDFLKSPAKGKNETLKDFFPTLQPRQIESLQNEFSKARGIEMACFIHQMVESKNLEFVKNSPRKSLTKFCNVFAEMDKGEYEAVRKLFSYDTYTLENEKHLENYNTKNRINTALKVG